ncbi:ABC transporter permease, partial [Gemmatimonadota bacterium]
MIRLPEFRRVFRVAIGRRGVDKDIDEEIAFHLDTRTEELIEEGVDPRQARDRAEQEFGEPRRYRAELRAGGRRKARRVRRVEVFDSLRQDLVYAVRQLWKNKGFTSAAVVALALGIGATTAIFSVVNAVVLRPLPFHQPDSLVRLYELTPQGRRYTTSEPTLLDWQVMPRSFQGVGAYTFARVTLTGQGEPESVTGGMVTHNLLPLLGIEPILGRGFLPEEDRPDADTRVLILSEGLWERRFGRDFDVVGRSLVVDGEPTTIIGVVSLRGIALIDFEEELEFLVPLAASPDASRSNHFITAIGRIAPGISRVQAQQEMDGIAQRIGEEYPRFNEGWGVRLVPIREWMIGPELGRTVFVLLGAVGLLLLLACANVSNLLVARGTTRVREIGVRAALGASRGRIVRQLLTESFILAGLGGMVGIALTYWTMPLARSFGPGNIPRLDEASVDGSVLGFALAVAVLTCLLFGLVPAFQAVRGELHEALKEGARSVVAGSRIRDLLVIGELALAVVVLVGAGLMGHSFIRLLSVDPGFESESVHSVRLQLPPSSGVEERLSFFRLLEERIR